MAGPSVSLGTSKGLEYVKGTFLGVSTTQRSQPVACDGAAEATGGGGSITGPPANTTLNESFPTLPEPRGWTVEGSATTQQDLTGYAICGGVNATVLTADVEIPSGSSATQQVFCGEGSATGGGIEASNVGVRIEATYPPELQTDNWFGLAKNTAVDERVVYYHTVCTDAYIVKYRNSELVRVKPGENGQAKAACKKDEAVLGGGFVGYSQGLPAPGGWANVSRPFDSKKDRKKVPDDGWVASYRNESVVNHRLLVRAVCKAGNAPT